MGRVIRPATDRDGAAISTLMRAAILYNNARDYPAHVIERLLFWHSPGAVDAMLAKRHVVVAEDSGCVVGTVALEAAVLRGLFVAVDHQGRGTAADLVRHIEDVARATEIASLSLQSSLTAHGFYEKQGYRTQAFRYHPEGSTYRMIKQIAPCTRDRPSEIPLVNSKLYVQIFHARGVGRGQALEEPQGSA